MLNLAKKYWDAQTFFIFLSWIVAIGIIGMFDLFEMAFDADRLRTTEYWTEVLTLILAGMLVFGMTLYYRYKKLLEQDEKSKEKEEEIFQAFSEVPSDYISEFTLELNNERRKLAYKDEISEKFQNLISEMTTKHPESLHTWLHGTYEEKTRDKRCRELLRLNSLLDEEYLEENKLTLPATFVSITPNFIQSGVNKTKGNSSLEDPAEGLATAISDNWLNFLLPVVTTSAIIGMVLTSSEESMWAIIFMTTVKTFALLIQRMSALAYADTFYKKTRIADLGLRYRLTFQYVRWVIREGKTKAKAKEKEAAEDAKQQRFDSGSRSTAERRTESDVPKRTKLGATTNQ